MKPKEYYDDEPVFYCQRCLSLAIVGEKNRLKCAECGANADKIDVTSIDRWSALYREKYGYPYVTAQTTVYDDLSATYEMDAISTLDETEALRNGLIVRDCVNLRWKDC